MEKTFLPIVKPEMKGDFLKKWKDWLVLSNDIEEKKLPGKLKPEFSSIDAEMIALAPKSYICYDFATQEQKDGRKGIPNSAKLELEDFRDKLYNDSEHYVKVNSLRLNRKKDMVRTTTMKRGLSSIHVKMSIDDNINTTPLKTTKLNFL